MKISECKEMMAYALGCVECKTDGETKRFDLKKINPEWEHYELTSRGYAKSNNNYSIYYDGKLEDMFGKEKYYFRILTIPEGWNLKHMAAILIAAIEMHKAEMPNKDLTI